MSSGRLTRLGILLVGVVLPSGHFKNRLLRMLGYSIHATADIRRCILLNVTMLHAGPNSRIGLGSVIRELRLVSLGSSARIGQWNWISSAPNIALTPTHGELIIGDHSAVTSRHYIDCSGGVEIGPFSTVAGVRSTFITHGIDWRCSEQSSAPIKIGSYCIVSSTVNLTPGTIVPDRSVVGMGVTVDRHLGASGGLVLAERGHVVKSPLRGEYFTRVRGYVDAPRRQRGGE